MQKKLSNDQDNFCGAAKKPDASFKRISIWLWTNLWPSPQTGRAGGMTWGAVHIPVPSASIFWQQHSVTTRLGITCQTHGSAVSEDRNWRDLVWGHAKWILHHHMGSMLYWKRCKIASPHLRFLFSERLNIVEEKKKNSRIQKKFHDAGY